MIKATRKLKSLVFSMNRGYRNTPDVYGGVNPIGENQALQKVITEFDHISSPIEREWLEKEYQALNTTPLPVSVQLTTLKMLQMSESFEHFVQKKFSNYKRYSGEGVESLTPCLYAICQEYKLRPSSLVLSLAHRGKLAVLVSLMNYPLRNLFWKIKGNSILPSELNTHQYYFIDDIATHIALTTERPEFQGMKISMVHNPSHLEIGGGVGMGKTRSKQDQGTEAMHVWVHGDAGLSGQGVVYELTQMAHLENYKVNGTIHIVANNQLGFTATEKEGRSSKYCTDVFKIIEAPIVHVNAMSPDDVTKLSILAVRYRNKFHNDFAIDLVGYRKYGHNEVDDPTFTSPGMYKNIKNLKGVTYEYSQELINKGITTQSYIDKLKKNLDQHLNAELSFSEIQNLEKDENGWLKVDSFKEQWKGFTPIHNTNKIVTGYSEEKLQDICRLSTTYPEWFKPHPILKKQLENRLENFKNSKIDWSTAESLAIGSLLKDGYSVRLSGEDVIRGTFSQRHLGFYCQDTEKLFIPFKDIKEGKLTIVNSLLSELGVLGFEYGYSIDHPNNLVLWESQFGDFANMSQSIIDTYVASGESKWLRQSGLVLLLPHGQEGQGPDHSSARLERALELVNDSTSSQLNIQVANCVYPSNYFHLLRSLMLRNFKRPLILGTPKSGLRNKFAISHLDDFNELSEFKPVILKNQGKGSKVLFVCNGKVYLDLLGQFENISIALIEELAPFPFNQLEKTVREEGKPIAWVQEEPRNLGVYNFAKQHLEKIDHNLQVISRPGLSASAIGNSVDNKAYQDIIYAQVSDLLS